MVVGKRASAVWHRAVAFVAAGSVVVELGCAGPATAPTVPPQSPRAAGTQVTPSDRARAFVGELAAGDWAHPRTPFDEAMGSAFPPDKVEALWGRLQAQAGAFVAVESTCDHEERGYRVVLVTCKFEHARLVLRVVLDKDGSVAGLFVQPADSAVAWTAPPYASPDSFVETSVQVGEAPALPGTLATPKGPGPFPAVALVHGSGPNDADETVGGVKVFKDLAWGLASRGIAVLRYTKRTKQSPAGVVTEKEEVLDGAHEAIALLRRADRVDPARIFVLGHSQGGGLAPRIAQSEPGLAGIVVLAGPTRSLQDLVVDQLEYIASLSPESTKLTQMIADARKFKATVEDPALRPDQHVSLPTGGGATGAYFLFERGYDPAAVARELSCRILVLQGERDYQVTMKDYGGWQAALGHDDRATLRTYRALNHLFVAGTGTPGPAEYEKPGHVDEAVVRDVAGWIGAG